MAANPIQKGQLDDQLKVCNAVAIPVDGNADVSAASIDMGMTSPRFGEGTRFEFILEVTTAFGKSAGSPYLTVEPICDTVSGLGSASPCGGAISILDGKGTANALYSIPLTWGHPNTKTRFLGLKLTPSTTQFTAGNVSAWLRPL